MRLPVGDPEKGLTVRVPSDSRPGLFHYVRRLPDGSWICDCGDHVHRHRICKHITKVRNRLRELEVA